MPWSEELKEEVRERIRENAAAAALRPEPELGLIDRDPNIWAGTNNTPIGHEEYRSAVRLKSGGPLMVYEEHDDQGNVLCYWVDDDEVMFGEFPEDDVVIVEQTEDLDT